jgi:hypothetical protein
MVQFTTKLHEVHEGSDFLISLCFIELNFSLRDVRVLRGRYFTTRNPEEPK